MPVFIINIAAIIKFKEPRLRAVATFMVVIITTKVIIIVVIIIIITITIELAKVFSIEVYYWHFKYLEIAFNYDCQAVY